MLLNGKKIKIPYVELRTASCKKWRQNIYLVYTGIKAFRSVFRQIKSAGFSCWEREN